MTKPNPTQPDTPKPQWMQQANCKNQPTHIFFPHEKQHKNPDAINCCKTCPVKTDCLNYAIEHNEKGIWAATTERQRARIKKRNTEQTRLRQLANLKYGGGDGTPA